MHAPLISPVSSSNLASLSRLLFRSSNSLRSKLSLFLHSISICLHYRSALGGGGGKNRGRGRRGAGERMGASRHPSLENLNSRGRESRAREHRKRKRAAFFEADDSFRPYSFLARPHLYLAAASAVLAYTREFRSPCRRVYLYVWRSPLQIPIRETKDIHNRARPFSSSCSLQL